MKVRTRREPGVTRNGDELAFFDELTGFDFELFQVGISARKAKGMLYTQ